MKKDFKTAVAQRRSHYSISKKTSVSDQTIREVVDHAVKYTPSAFNSQSARVVLLLDKEHDKMWDITKESLRKVVPADSFEQTNDKINSFKNGYGTVLYFEDQSIVEGLQEEFSLYKDNFPVWSEQSSGMLQFVVWTALADEGFGGSLQHYNELIENDVKSEWNLPDKWKLIAQMPFGHPESEPGNKEYAPLENRIRVYK